MDSRTRPVSASKWGIASAIALALAAPVSSLQAIVNSGGDAPLWARSWNGFRMADEARGRLSGDPGNPQAGLTLGTDAPALARAAYAQEPLASDAVFVLALAESGSLTEYRASPTARLGAEIDKRNALLELLLIADAARREDYRAMFDYADVLAAANPDMARIVLAPLFDQLGDPAVLPVVTTALDRNARWADAFRSYVPGEEAALRNYLSLRRQAPAGSRWESDDRLIKELVKRRMFDEAFAVWRLADGESQNQYGFITGDRFAPIGWQQVARGDRTAQVDSNGTMSVSVERGAGGEVARQLLDLPPGRYRLETTVQSTDSTAPLWIALSCAEGSNGERQPLKPQVEFAVASADCPAYWLIVGASALESRRRLEATISGWRFSRAS